ncbi:MAG: hypothetical protein ABFC88_13070 [Thermoguttaceae bacterium]
MSEHRFTCAVCGAEKVHTGEFTTGYGMDNGGNKVCYDCCGKREWEYMRDTGRATLYLVDRQGCGWEVTNWPGTLKFRVRSIRKGSHNLAGARYDVRFIDSTGAEWHGVTYGNMTQICHCRRLKQKGKRAA